MSALGQKQTCAMQNGYVCFTPKADMCSARAYVRFIPKCTDIAAIKDLILQARWPRFRN
jgi:hypothetical protein